MLESIEGKRGYPRHRPPPPGRAVRTADADQQRRDPVLDPRHRREGPEWFASQGRHGSKGLRSYSVSGRVKESGVKLAPAGITARELIDEFCGGMAAGHTFKAYLPAARRAAILPASLADIPLDFGKLEQHGCFVGSHAVVVLSDQDDMRAVALNLLRFFEDESCGQCTPCRVGCEKAVKLMQRSAGTRCCSRSCAGRWRMPRSAASQRRRTRSARS